MDQNTFEDFLQKVTQQKHTEAEIAEFLTWLQTRPQKQAAEALDRYEQAFRPTDVINNDTLERISAGIENRLGTPHDVPVIPPKRTPLVFYLKIAAVFIIVSLLAFLFLKPKA